MKQKLPITTTNRDILGLKEADTNARHEAIRVDVARRLRKACSHLSEEEFAALVAKIVGVQLKAERGLSKIKDE
jgi:hypothetical protein